MNKRMLVVLVSLMMAGCSGAVPNIGVNNGKLMSCPQTPNCVSSQAIDEEHFIQPIRYKGTQQAAQDRLLLILKSEKRVKILTIEANYVRVEFTSALFRFVDDAEFYFTEEKAGETVIHIRSASRVGYSDFGVNRKRIEQIRGKV